MKITLELLNKAGLSGFAKEFFENWFKENNITEIAYSEALQGIKDNRDLIETSIQENNSDETYDYYLKWFEWLSTVNDFVMFDGNYVFLNKWRVGSKEFNSLKEAQEFQKSNHDEILEAKKQYLTISGITKNPDGTETYKAVNIVDALEPEESEEFEFTVQETGERRRTQSPTLAAIGLFQQKLIYDQYARCFPMIEQQVQNGELKAWTQIA